MKMDEHHLSKYKFIKLIEALKAVNFVSIKLQCKLENKETMLLTNI